MEAELDITNYGWKQRPLLALNAVLIRQPAAEACSCGNYLMIL
jgi:hypothetical protein